MKAILSQNTSAYRNTITQNEANLTAYLRLSNSEDNRKSSKDGIVPRSIEPHSITNRYSDNYDSSSMTPGYISYCNVEPRRIEATKNNLKDAYV